ncbi:MAG: 2-C-methyl-D-erythritol 2,4-cyclodiphosphate synthase [Candidatus Brocadiales bacterium]
MLLLGIGYDIHRLVEGRKLFLGGIEFDSPAGLLGHSDADVVLHAICDALLGAAALGDIGEHFPDDDPRWKDISSTTLTEKVLELIKKEGLKVNNVDVMVLAQRPRLGAKKGEMRQKVAQLLGISPRRVSIKATTMEGLDAIGRGEAIAAQAAVTLLSA